MEKLLKGEENPLLVGFCQAVAVSLYCALVAGFLFLMESTSTEPGYLGVVLMLTLFVLSAAITGFLVFGLAAYYALKNKIRMALEVLFSTLVSICLIAVVVAVGVLL